MFISDQNIERLVTAMREAVHSERGLRLIQAQHKSVRGKGLAMYKETYVPEVDLKDIAQSIIHKCQGDADALGGKQQYSLVFFFGKNTHYELGCRFALTGRQIDEEGEWGSEPATTKGHRAQMMRHNEGMFETTIRATQGMMQGQVGLLNKAYDRIEYLEEKLNDLMEKQRALLDARHEQEIERLVLEKREDRKDEMVEVIKTLAFPLVNKITGMKMLPEDGGGNALTTLLDTFDMEQIGELQKVLKPHQMTLVMSMMNEHVSQDDDKPKQLPAKTTVTAKPKRKAPVKSKTNGKR